jgi:integrase
MATVFRRGGYWRAQVRRKGYPKESRTFDTKSEADAWARLVESEMDRGVFISRRQEESTTLFEALERYGREVAAEKGSDENRQGKIRRWQRNPLASRLLSTLRGADFAEYRDTRRSQGKAENTIRLELILISSLFTTARREWGMEGLANPIASIKKPSTGRPRYRRLSRLEERLLLDAAGSSCPTEWCKLFAVWRSA